MNSSSESSVDLEEFADLCGAPSAWARAGKTAINSVAWTSHGGASSSSSDSGKRSEEIYLHGYELAGNLDFYDRCRLRSTLDGKSPDTTSTTYFNPPLFAVAAYPAGKSLKKTKFCPTA